MSSASALRRGANVHAANCSRLIQGMVAPCSGLPQALNLIRFSAKPFNPVLGDISNIVGKIDAIEELAARALETFAVGAGRYFWSVTESSHSSF